MLALTTTTINTTLIIITSTNTIAGRRGRGERFDFDWDIVS
jgi:hypothetical protein